LIGSEFFPELRLPARALFLPPSTVVVRFHSHGQIEWLFRVGHSRSLQSRRVVLEALTKLAYVEWQVTEVQRLFDPSILE